MNRSNMFHLVVVILILSIVGLIGCSGNEDVIGPAPFPKIAEVFIDQFGSSVGFEAFLVGCCKTTIPENFSTD